jgi:hypothetical protein
LAPDAIKGNVIDVSVISTSDVASDQEWKTATKKFGSTAVISRAFTNTPNTFRTLTANGKVMATYTVPSAGVVKVTLKNLQGKAMLSRMSIAKAGMNALVIPANYHGVLILQIQQGNKEFSGKVICH